MIITSSKIGSIQVVSVNYPGLPSNKTHKIANELLHGGYGGMIALDLGTANAAITLVEVFHFFFKWKKFSESASRGSCCKSWRSGKSYRASWYVKRH